MRTDSTSASSIPIPRKMASCSAQPSAEAIAAMRRSSRLSTCTA
nr:MAG TPA_asm: hypothetical protein [Caudoviricetes sp.]